MFINVLRKSQGIITGGVNRSGRSLLFLFFYIFFFTDASLIIIWHVIQLYTAVVGLSRRARQNLSEKNE